MFLVCEAIIKHVAMMGHERRTSLPLSSRGYAAVSLNSFEALMR